jgi:hypothetical protein
MVSRNEADMQLKDSSFFKKVRSIFKGIYWAWVALWFLDMVSVLICLLIPPPDNPFSRFVFYVNLGYAELLIISMSCLALTITIVSIFKRRISILEFLVLLPLCFMLLIFAPNWRT